MKIIPPRYNCQLALPGFGVKAQQLLKSTKVLIVGVGGLGCPAAQYLVAAGVGTVGIADNDTISQSNLHRQILYADLDTGAKKVVIARQKLQLQNPGVNVVAHDTLITEENVLDIIRKYDVVVDCTDNFVARYLINDACVILGKPLVYGAVYQYEGQVSIWNVKREDGTFSPNYRDIFPDVNESMIPNCAEGGVLPTLAGIIGCMQANEAIKYITDTGEILAGRMLIFDALTLQSRIINTMEVTQTNISSLPLSITIPVISSIKLNEEINKYELVDVRSEEERDEFNIGGIHIPLGEVESKASMLYPGKPVVFYCASGKRSELAARLVKSKYPKATVYSLEGGTNNILNN